MYHLSAEEEGTLGWLNAFLHGAYDRLSLDSLARDHYRLQNLSAAQNAL